MHGWTEACVLYLGYARAEGIFGREGQKPVNWQRRSRVLLNSIIPLSTDPPVWYFVE